MGLVGSQLAVAVAIPVEAEADTSVVAATTPAVQAQMDMWVSIGGAASQLFSLDLTVSTPVIFGSHVVSDQVGCATFGLTNLDADVVSIQAGPGSLGVVSTSTFINNLDGTGQFRACFDLAEPVRYLTVVATDDVDNESAESPVFVVNSLEQAKLSDTFALEPLRPASQDVCDRLLAGVPETNFVLRRQYVVPYRYGPTDFQLSAVSPNSPVEIIVTRQDRPGEANQQTRYVVTPGAAETVVALDLGRGINVVTGFDQQGRTSTAIVAATTYQAVLCSYAQEIYNNSRVRIDEQEAAIFSPVSTRLAEPFIGFTDLLPDVRSFQTLGAKLAIRSLVGDPGKQDGFIDLLAGLSQSTPVVVAETPDPEIFEPYTVPLFNRAEGFAGVDAHVWLANPCVTKWVAFIRYLANLEPFRLISISEQEVVFYDDNGIVQRHVFDFSSEECSLTGLALDSLCFDNIEVGIQVFGETSLMVCAAQYPFDMSPTPQYPFLRLAEETVLDPGFDGFRQVSLTRRFDGGGVLDSMGPVASLDSGLPPCVYPEGYIVTPLWLSSAGPVVDAAPTVTAEYTEEGAVQLFADLEVSLDMIGIELTSGLDVNLRHAWPTATLDMLVQTTEQVVAGLDLVVSQPAATAYLNVSIV